MKHCSWHRDCLMQGYSGLQSSQNAAGCGGWARLLERALPRELEQVQEQLRVQEPRLGLQPGNPWSGGGARETSVRSVLKVFHRELNTLVPRCGVLHTCSGCLVRDPGCEQHALAGVVQLRVVALRQHLPARGTGEDCHGDIFQRRKGTVGLYETLLNALVVLPHCANIGSCAATLFSSDL